MHEMGCSFKWVFRCQSLAASVLPSLRTALSSPQRWSQSARRPQRMPNLAGGLADSGTEGHERSRIAILPENASLDLGILWVAGAKTQPDRPFCQNGRSEVGILWRRHLPNCLGGTWAAVDDPNDDKCCDARQLQNHGERSRASHLHNMLGILPLGCLAPPGPAPMPPQAGSLTFSQAIPSFLRA